MPNRKHTTKPAKTSRSKTSQSHQASGAEAQRRDLGRSDLSGNEASLNRASGLTAFTWRDRPDSVPRLSIERAKLLVGRIILEDDDDQAAALIELITGVAYDYEATNRNNLALTAAGEAFSRTSEFSTRLDDFAVAAATGDQLVRDIYMVQRRSQHGEDAARAAGRLCADTAVTFKRASQAFQDEMIAEVLRQTSQRPIARTLTPARAKADSQAHAAALLDVSPDQLARLINRQSRKKSMDHGLTSERNPTQLTDAQGLLLAMAKAKSPEEAVEGFMRGMCGHLLLSDVLRGVERGMIGEAIDSTAHGTLAEVADKLGQDEQFLAERVNRHHYDYWLRMRENERRRGRRRENQ